MTVMNRDSVDKITRGTRLIWPFVVLLCIEFPFCVMKLIGDKFTSPSNSFYDKEFSNTRDGLFRNLTHSHHENIPILF